LTGTLISVTAGVSTAAVVITRTHLYLKKMNAEMFSPRGLKVSICKGKDLPAKLGFSADREDFSEASENSGSAGSHPMTMVPLDPRSPESASLRKNIMHKLDAYIAPLDVDVSPPTGPRNIIDKMSAQMIERTTRKKEAKVAKRTDRFGRKVEKRQAKIREREENLAALGIDGSCLGPNEEMLQREAVTRHANKDWDGWYDESDDGREIGKRAKVLIEMQDGKFESDKDRARFEEKKAKLDAKVEKRRMKVQGKLEEQKAKLDKKFDKRSAKESKKAGKMEFMLIESL
jgi:hypothetical protein